MAAKLTMSFHMAGWAVAAALAWTQASALVTRHDRPDAQYRKAGAALRQYCKLNAPDGAGVLIGASWVLTAAHLAGDLKPQQSISCGGVSAHIKQVISHPGWDGKKDDIALVELATPIKEIRPVELWRTRDEIGLMLKLVGHFQGGTGLTGSTDAVPRALRGGTNKVSAVDSRWIRFIMDGPASEDVTKLEAVSGSGDSGAPAWIKRRGHVYVVGIGSHSRDLNQNGLEPDYGDEDVFARVSSYAAWIDQTIIGKNAK